jgi:hypothetical protein
MITYLLCTRCQRRRAVAVTVEGVYKARPGRKHYCADCAPAHATPGMTYRVVDGIWIAIGETNA